MEFKGVMNQFEEFKPSYENKSEHPFHLDKPIIIFDLEGTTKFHSGSRIVQIGMIKCLSNGKVIRKNRLVNPECQIPKDSMAIHGITNEMVSNKPKFKEISKSLFEFIKDCDYGGFNVNLYDLPVLRNEFKRCGIEFNYLDSSVIDSYYIEKAMNYNKKQQYSLSAIYERYNDNSFDNAHDAMADVEATINIMEHQLYKNKLGGYTTDDVITGLVDRLETDSFIPKKYYDSTQILEVDGEYFWGFGKNKGNNIKEDLSYVHWVLNNPSFGKDIKDIVKKIL